MIKILIIVIVFVTGHQCKPISEEVLVRNNAGELTADISDNAASRSAKSENTQELSKEASVVEEERTAKSESSEGTEERKAADSENTGERHARSTEQSRVANIDNRRATTKTSVNEQEARQAISSDSSEASSKTASNESNGDKSSRTSIRSEENYSEARSDTEEAKSGSIETKTAERDDVSHIINKEVRQASGEESIDSPSSRSSSENNSKSASKENENSKIASAESKNSGEAAQLRSANREEDIRSSPDADQDNARSDSDTDVGVEALVRSDIADLANPTTAGRRMLEQNSNLRYDSIETPSSPDTSDTRMAPQEHIPLLGHQVHSNYFAVTMNSPITKARDACRACYRRMGKYDSLNRIQAIPCSGKGSSRSSQSQYPYSPLDSSSPLSFLPFSFSKESPPVPSQVRQSLPPQNPIETHRRLKPLPPMDPNQPFRMLPPLPSLDRTGLLKTLPPLQPLEPNKLFGSLPPLRPLQSIGQFNSMPHFPPLEPFGTFRSLPPLPPLGPIFKSQQQFPSMDRQALPEPSFDSPNQNWPPQQPFQNLLNSMANIPQFNPPLNMFSMSRQAEPEESPQMSGSFSTKWNTFETAPMTYRSAVSFQHSSQ